MATVFVTKPGNLSDPKRLQELNNFVEDMERLNGTWGESWGPAGSNYFMRDFQVFQQCKSSEKTELTKMNIFSLQR